jgi:copper chaperone CopZ
MKKLVLYGVVLMVCLVPVLGADVSPNARIAVDVKGLVCDFCARSLEKFLGKQPAVADVSINLENKVIHIELVPGEMVDDDRLTQWVTDAGYAVQAIRHGE